MGTNNAEASAVWQPLPQRNRQLDASSDILKFLLCGYCARDRNLMDRSRKTQRNVGKINKYQKSIYDYIYRPFTISSENTVIFGAYII